MIYIGVLDTVLKCDLWIIYAFSNRDIYKTNGDFNYSAIHNSQIYDHCNYSYKYNVLTDNV